MTDKVDSYIAERDYISKTYDLRKQQAGLELANHIRKCIEAELMERRWKGNWAADVLKMYFGEAPPPAINHGELPIHLSWAKTNADRIKTINELLAPHVEAGNIPEFTLGEDVKDGRTRIVLICDVVVT